MNTDTMARGEYEVWQATGRRASICPLLRKEEQDLIEQLHRHWPHRNNGDKAKINSRYFCYDAIWKLRYWRYHYQPNICPRPHAVEGIAWDREDGKQVCPICWNPSKFVEYEARVKLVLKSKRFTSSEKRTFLEKWLKRFEAKCKGEPPMIEEKRVHFLRKKLDTFDTEFPQLELF